MVEVAILGSANERLDLLPRIDEDRPQRKSGVSDRNLPSGKLSHFDTVAARVTPLALLPGELRGARSGQAGVVHLAHFGECPAQDYSTECTCIRSCRRPCTCTT